MQYKSTARIIGTRLDQLASLLMLLSTLYIIMSSINEETVLSFRSHSSHLGYSAIPVMIFLSSLLVKTLLWRLAPNPASAEVQPDPPAEYYRAFPPLPAATLLVGVSLCIWWYFLRQGNLDIIHAIRRDYSQEPPGTVFFIIDESFRKYWLLNDITLKDIGGNKLDDYLFLRVYTDAQLARLRGKKCNEWASMPRGLADRFWRNKADLPENHKDDDGDGWIDNAVTLSRVNDTCIPLDREWSRLASDFPNSCIPISPFSIREALPKNFPHRRFLLYKTDRRVVDVTNEIFPRFDDGR